ncbi:DUF3048 domain-containing protein [Candidatus Peregrinibacteria bacterium]|nr:DUF3048 domain-containing protein [Candidatus Peregrinibacteria bacterium]
MMIFFVGTAIFLALWFFVIQEQSFTLHQVSQIFPNLTSAIQSDQTSSPRNVSKNVLPTEKYISALDGTVLSAPEGPVIAVMIENHPQARVQHEGLSKASIVYEALAEGGITRFLALYSYQNLSWVGPVRSARPYFIDFASEYKAAYVHAGGSNDALTRLYSTKDLLNIEALYWEEISPESDTRIAHYFARDIQYAAPHNLFGSFAGIQSIINDKKWNVSLDRPHFLFGNVSSSVSGSVSGSSFFSASVSRFDIHFSTPSFEVEYVYDPVSDRYVRYLAGNIHHDSTGDITPRNILVQFTSYYPIDDEGRLEMKTSGSGKAFLFSGGRQYFGVWKKESDDVTRFYDDSGQQFVLRPGQTWITILNDEKSLEIYP